MKQFRFPLDRALQWRRMQCELEEAAGAQLAGQRSALAQKSDEIAGLRKAAADSLLSAPTVVAAEFQTIAHFNVFAERQKTRIRAASQELERKAEAQLLRTAEARRKLKLLETLRASRLEKWTALRDAEDEQATADAWLSRYAAERYTTHNAT